MSSRPAVDDLGGQALVDRGVHEAGRGLEVPEKRPVAGDDRSHQAQFLVERAHLPRRARRDQHYLDPRLADVADGPLGSLGDVARAGEQGAVEVDEDQAHDPAGADELGQTPGDVVQVLAHGLARLLFVTRALMARRMASCCCCRAMRSAGLLVVGGEDGRHVVVQEVDRLLDDALKERIVRGFGDGQRERPRRPRE